MRVIPRHVHAMIDYPFGAILIIAPFLLGFQGAAFWVPALVGVAVIAMSLVTDYEYSVAKVVPMSTHLAVDIAGGLLVLVSPWLFGFASLVMWPHVILGLLQIGSGLMTKTEPEPTPLGA